MNPDTLSNQAIPLPLALSRQLKQQAAKALKSNDFRERYVSRLAGAFGMFAFFGYAYWRMGERYGTPFTFIALSLALVVLMLNVLGKEFLSLPDVDVEAPSQTEPAQKTVADAPQERRTAWKNRFWLRVLVHMTWNIVSLSAIAGALLWPLLLDPIAAGASAAQPSPASMPNEAFAMLTATVLIAGLFLVYLAVEDTRKAMPRGSRMKDSVRGD